jgi:L-arabinokinase
VARHLCAAGHEVHIVTGVPEFVFRKDIRSPKLHIRKVKMATIHDIHIVFT